VNRLNRMHIKHVTLQVAPCPIRPICGFLLLSILAALIAVFSPVANAQATSSASVRTPISFAYTDFDGDQRIDLAVVSAGRSELMEYWVQLQLSASGARAIRVVGPAGGLQIASRDVNGDQAPDLILTTTWGNKPVAILLNDGHGSFSSLDPSLYPEAFDAPSTNWTSSAFPQYDLLTVPSQWRCTACAPAIRLPILDSFCRAACLSASADLLSRDSSCLDRAPPCDRPRL
jgi:hypothetical protein